MQYLHYRDLAGIGLTDEQIKAIAAAVTVPQGLDDQGEPKEGPGDAGEPVPLARSRTSRRRARRITAPCRPTCR